jgi:TPP-dependent pyruvate/acetoin dehydrogenase alpha subunit
MYGIEPQVCDGNNVLDVFSAVRIAVDKCRAGKGPAAIVADTFRMGGHATHDEQEARETFPAELFKEWGQRDPIGLFEGYMTGEGITVAGLEAVELEVIREIDQAIEDALKSRDLVPAPEKALYDGFSEGGVLIGLEKRPI